MSNRSRRPNGGGTIYQRKDGRYEGAAWVTGPDGTRKRIRVYGHTWDETNKALTKALAEHQATGHITADKQTLADYLTTWMTTIAPTRVRANTLTQYEHVVRHQIIPGLGTKKLQALKAKDVRTWLETLATRCRCCANDIDAKRSAGKQRCCAVGACCHQHYAPRRIQYIHGVLSVALAHAVREDLIPRNPAKQVQTPAGPPRRFEPLTLTEAQHFLTAARHYPNGELYELALRLGLRRSELLGLHWTDIDHDSKTLTIRRTIQRLRGQGLTVMPTKTNTSDRRIPLSDACLTALRLHQDYHDGLRRRAGTLWHETGYIFTTSIGTPLDPQKATLGIKNLCQQAGVHPIRFHDLRHTCATLLIESGVPLVTVQQLLGHATITITVNIYTHTRLPHQADALGKLDAQLGTSKSRTRTRPTANLAAGVSPPTRKTTTTSNSRQS